MNRPVDRLSCATRQQCTFYVKGFFWELIYCTFSSTMAKREMTCCDHVTLNWQRQLITMTTMNWTNKNLQRLVSIFRRLYSMSCLHVSFLPLSDLRVPPCLCYYHCMCHIVQPHDYSFLYNHHLLCKEEFFVLSDNRFPTVPSPFKKFLFKK